MLSCKRVVDSVTDAQYFFLVNFHEDTRDPEHSTTFDIEIADGSTAWSQVGRPFAVLHSVYTNRTMLSEAAVLSLRSSPSHNPNYGLDGRCQAGPYNQI